MLPLSFDHVTPEAVLALIAAKTREGRHLDFKRELPTGGNDPKKEFLADVTSFANAGGGVMVFGVSEEKDVNGKPTGIPDDIVGLVANLDAEVLRLEQWLRTGIEPRLPAHRFHIVEAKPGALVLVLVVKASWRAPHMVATAESRFYARTSAGKYPLDVTEIRGAFLRGEELPARIRRFRDERLGLISAAETPAPLRDGSRLVLHVVPMSGLGDAVPVDLQGWAKPSPPCLDGSLMGSHFNADGHVGYTGSEARGTTGYVQLFRTGVVEAVAVYHHESGGIPVMNIWHAETEIVAGLKTYLRTLTALGVEAPFSVSLSLVGVRGYGLVSSPLRDLGGRAVVLRDVVSLPDVLVEDADAEPSRLMRPIFDALWQTFGVSRSLCYDESGNRIDNFRW